MRDRRGENRDQRPAVDWSRRGAVRDLARGVVHMIWVPVVWVPVVVLAGVGHMRQTVIMFAGHRSELATRQSAGATDRFGASTAGEQLAVRLAERVPLGSRRPARHGP